MGKQAEVRRTAERPKDLSGVLLIPTSVTREAFLGPGKYGSRPPIIFQVQWRGEDAKDAAGNDLGPRWHARWMEGSDILYPGAVEDILRAGLVLAAEGDTCDGGMARARRVRSQLIGLLNGYPSVTTSGIMGTRENWESNPLTPAYSLAHKLKGEGLADYVLIDQQGFEWPDLGRP